MKYRLTRQAERDVSTILTDTYRIFGETQFHRYIGILNTGIGMIADEPFRPTSKARKDIREGVRSFHLQLATGRRGGASHVIYYKPTRSADREEIIIIRILGDEMEPKRRIASALNSKDPE